MARGNAERTAAHYRALAFRKVWIILVILNRRSRCLLSNWLGIGEWDIFINRLSE